MLICYIEYSDLNLIKETIILTLCMLGIKIKKRIKFSYLVLAGVK